MGACNALKYIMMMLSKKPHDLDYLGMVYLGGRYYLLFWLFFLRAGSYDACVYVVTYLHLTMQTDAKFHS